MIPSTAASSSVTNPGTSGVAATRAASAPPMSARGIQSEIDHASAGATIHVPSGMYIGQLRIDKDLRRVGAGAGSTTIHSPSTMTADFLGNVFVIEIGNGATVQISELSVRVTEQCMLSNSIGVATGAGMGVRVNSTLHIWGVERLAFGPAPNLDMTCTTHGSPGMLSFGRGLSIGLDDGPGVGPNLQVEGHGWVDDVTLRAFDIFTISVGGVRGPSGSTATITHNSITDNTYYGLDLIDANQIFRSDVVVAGLYAIAVGAENAITTAILAHDTMHGWPCVAGGELPMGGEGSGDVVPTSR